MPPRPKATRPARPGPTPRPAPTDRLDLPETGVGRAAGLGVRTLAFVVDAILANILAIAVDGGYQTGGRANLVVYAAFLVIELVFVSLAGQTPGMRLLGIAVVPVSGESRPKPQWVLLRTVLLAIIAPAVILDSSGRALHDRAAGTITVHTR